jgi:murein DD-endopeptidase MepM/ murein hydrolase activator NlpD
MQIEPAICPVCGAAYDPLRSRAVKVIDGRVRAFCSDTCKERGLKPVELVIDELADTAGVAPIRESRWKNLSGISVALVLIIAGGFAVLLQRTSKRASASLPSAMIQGVKKPAPPPTLEDAMKLMRGSEDAPDIWYHPLAGTARRMPDAPSRRFGAGRDGDRPGECGSGHCGVDLGRVKGEIVIAIHDGVIERIVRDPNEGGRRGNEGRFIRINHKGGTVVSSYMHLDGLRADLRPGIPVKAGEAIGTIGDTGVHHSGPHLHFAVSVRPSLEGNEMFIDPEPMLHLWPLKKTAIATLHAMQPAPRQAPRPTAQADNVEDM